MDYYGYLSIPKPLVKSYTNFVAHWDRLCRP